MRCQNILFVRWGTEHFLNFEWQMDACISCQKQHYETQIVAFWLKERYDNIMCWNSVGRTGTQKVLIAPQLHRSQILNATVSLLSCHVALKMNSWSASFVHCNVICWKAPLSQFSGLHYLINIMEWCPWEVYSWSASTKIPCLLWNP